MDIEKVGQLLEELGWAISSDETGDSVAKVYREDIVVRMLYGIRKFQNGFQLEANYSLSTKPFIETCAKILRDESYFAPLIRSFSGYRVKASLLKNKHVESMSKHIVEWAEVQNVEQAIEQLRLLPTTAPGARPLWLLAALALLGDISTLSRYKRSFESGDRLGFANYINLSHIDRSLEIAEKR